MSIYHCSIKIISRASGRSAVASAAYRSGEKLYNDETGLVHDFTKKGGVVYSEIMLPVMAPEEYKNREILWNEVQKVEKRADAQFAREIEVAFPVEMDRNQQIDCIKNYISKNFTEAGMIADFAIHDKGDGNPHAHIMLTMRGFDDNKQWEKKQKTVFANSRDQEGRPVYNPDLPSYDPKDKKHTGQYRIPALDEEGNQKVRVRKGKGREYLWERITIPMNDWNDHSKAERWRESWAQECNRYLSPETQIDHRSYERQGIDLEPSIHEGVAARQMESKGLTADRCKMNREIRKRNSFRMEIRKLAQEITEFITEKAREIYERIKKLRGNIDNTSKAGRDGRHHRAASRRDGKPGGRDLEVDRTAGRILNVKRAADISEQKITATDRRIDEIKRQIVRKEGERDARIRRIMERRAASDRNGEDAGSDRFPDRREREVERDGLTETTNDIQSFLADLAAKERTSEKLREDRETERSRLGTGRERETQRGQQQSAEDIRKSKRRSWDYGPEL